MNETNVGDDKYLMSMALLLVNGKKVYAKVRWNTGGRFCLRYPIVISEMDPVKLLPESEQIDCTVLETAVIAYGLLSPDAVELLDREASFLYDPFAKEAEADFRKHLRESYNG